MDRTTLWRCYHQRRRDGPTPTAAGKEEESAPWPQHPRPLHRWHAVVGRSAGPKAPPVADHLYWRWRRGSRWWLSTSRASPQQEESRGATARATKLLLAWVAAKAAWTVTRSDF